MPSKPKQLQSEQDPVERNANASLAGHRSLPSSLESMSRQHPPTTSSLHFWKQVSMTLLVMKQLIKSIDVY